MVTQAAWVIAELTFHLVMILSSCNVITSSRLDASQCVLTYVCSISFAFRTFLIMHVSVLIRTFLLCSISSSSLGTSHNTSLLVEKVVSSSVGPDNLAGVETSFHHIINGSASTSRLSLICIGFQLSHRPLHQFCVFHSLIGKIR